MGNQFTDDYINIVLQMQACLPTLHSLHSIQQTNEKRTIFYQTKNYFGYLAKRNHLSKKRQASNLEDEERKAQFIFPVVVNNKIRSFKSERCMVQEDPEDYYGDISERRNCNKSNRNKVIKAKFQLNAREINSERNKIEPKAIFEAIRINKMSIQQKQGDIFRKTDYNFKNPLSFFRKQSWPASNERPKMKSKSFFKQSISGWETGAIDFQG